MDNNIGLHFGYWLKDWDGNLLNIIDKVNEIGFTALEIDSDIMLSKSKKKREKIKKKLEKYNLNLNFCIGMKSKYDVSSKSKKTRRRGIEHVKEIIEMVNAMGSNTLSGVCYGQWNPDVKKAKEKDEYLKRSIESVSEIVDFAEKYGVNYNLEAVNRYEQFILNTAKEALEYIEKIDSPNLNILLDTYHMNIEEDDFKEAILRAGDNLGHFHIGENNRKPPGEGSVMDWDTIFDSLKDIDYKGDIVMEPFVNPGGEIGFDTRVWRDMNDKNLSLEKRIADALNFIKTKMK